MNYYRILAAATAVAAVPVTGFAQEFTGAATLGYGRSSASGGAGDINSYSLDAAGTVNFQNGFYLGYDASFLSAEPTNTATDFGLSDIGIDLTYQFANGVVVGGYLDYADTTLNNVLPGYGVGLDISSYGLSAGYVGDTMGVEFHLGESSTDPSLASGVDWTDYGVNFRYRAGDATRLGLHYVRSELSGPGGSASLSDWGIGADHSFGSGWNAFGGYARSSDSGGIDIDTIGVGVGYDFAQTGSFPGQVSVELARSDASAGGLSGDVDTLRFGLTMPLGTRTSATPLNSVARAAMAPRHNAVTSLIGTLF